MAVYITPARPLRWDYILVTWKIGQVTYYRKAERFGDTRRNYPANIGYAKELAPESIFHFYVLSQKNVTLPRWIRLGKWMSKASVEIMKVEDIEDRKRQGAFAAISALNPLDVVDSSFEVFDIISMPPSSLIVNARLDGDYYEVGGPGKGIPANMRFTIPDIK